jgi:nucleoside-diphosphate-sugar epimerase
MNTALVIGGTGPTGPYVVNGLVDRGFQVTILHTGRHEADLIGPEVEHIHTDPFDVDRTAADLGDRTFDLAVVMYGRLRDLAQLLRGKVGHFVSIGGVGVYKGFANPDDLFPEGMPVPLGHDSELVDDREQFVKLRRIRETEEEVFLAHPEAIHLRYPQLYGPRQLLPREWPIVRRALDKRPFLIVPDGGLTVKSQAWVENAAHATLLAVDRPSAAVGKIYNVSDEELFTIRQIAEIVADELGHSWEIVSLPHEVATSARPLLTSWSSSHRVLDIRATITDLGYRDVVKPETAWRLATRWLADHPLERGGDLEGRLQDPFEYSAEDLQYSAWAECRQSLAAVTWSSPPGYSSAYVGRFANPASD